MQKEADLKDIAAFKQLKSVENLTYLYKAILKFESTLKKDGLVSYMTDIPEFNQQKYEQSIDAVTKGDISEDDFKKIVKNLNLKTVDINTMYERLLRKQVTYHTVY